MADMDWSEMGGGVWKYSPGSGGLLVGSGPSISTNVFSVVSCNSSRHIGHVATGHALRPGGPPGGGRGVSTGWI
jgi:hypothetical protein